MLLVIIENVRIRKIQFNLVRQIQIENGFSGIEQL